MPVSMMRPATMTRSTGKAFPYRLLGGRDDLNGMKMLVETNKTAWRTEDLTKTSKIKNNLE